MVNDKGAKVQEKSTRGWKGGTLGSCFSRMSWRFLPPLWYQPPDVFVVTWGKYVCGISVWNTMTRFVTKCQSLLQETRSYKSVSACATLSWHELQDLTDAAKWTACEGLGFPGWLMTTDPHNIKWSFNNSANISAACAQKPDQSCTIIFSYPPSCFYCQPHQWYQSSPPSLSFISGL